MTTPRPTKAFKPQTSNAEHSITLRQLTKTQRQKLSLMLNRAKISHDNLPYSERYIISGLSIKALAHWASIIRTTLDT